MEKDNRRVACGFSHLIILFYSGLVAIIIAVVVVVPICILMRERIWVSWELGNG